MWNTLRIQNGALIEEEWEEHYGMTCEYTGTTIGRRSLFHF